MTTSAGAAPPPPSSARPSREPGAHALPPDAGVATRVWLVAVLTVACLEAVLAGGPLLDRWFASGTARGVLAGIVAYAAAGLVAGLVLLVAGRPTGVPDGRAVLGAVGLVALLRVVLQALGSPPADGASHGGLAFDVVGLGAVAASVAALTLAVALVAGTAAGSGPVAVVRTGATGSAHLPDGQGGWPGGARQAALGLVLGCGLSVGLASLLGTWDAVWRHDWVGWVVTLAVVAAAIGAARALSSGGAAARAHAATSAGGATVHDTGAAAAAVLRVVEPGGRPRRLWALGPFVAFAAMLGANPAFAAARSGVALGVSALALVAAWTAGGWLLLRPEAWRGPARVAAAVVLVAGAAGGLTLGGWAVLVALGVADVAAGIVLTGVLNARRGAPPGIPRTAGATAAAGLGIAIPAVLHQLRPGGPLPADAAWAVVLAAAVLGLAGLRRRTPGPWHAEPDAHPPARTNAVRLLLLPAVVLALLGLVPSTASARGAPVAARAGSNHLTVVDWNLHHEVSPLTAVDLEGIAREIASVHPDVVTLQDVGRGWPPGGGVDATTWLAHRLDMTVAFAPTADRQPGTAILARAALHDVAVHELPDDGPRRRSALAATVLAADGTPLRITSVDLRSGVDGTPTRLDEIQALLADEPPDGAALLAGDLEAPPGSPEAALVTGAGWTSAIDAAGDTAALTSTSTRPTERLDWVLGHGVVFTGSNVPHGPRQSDRLPVVARVTIGDSGVS